MTDTPDTKPTLLIVDDSRLMRMAARKILKDEFNLLEAGDGEQAWESLQAHADINLVMSDLSMPVLDGLGLLKRIREAEQARIQHLPVIIVTGAEDDDGSRQTALAAGASDFITKPFEPLQLVARAKAQAKHQRTQQALVNSENSKQQLEQNSHLDLLTGLLNARGFTNSLEEQLSYARRHRTDLALLLIRIDKYKVLYLRHGKQAIESAVQRIAQLVREPRRREDMVARLDLDTLAVLLPSANTSGARQVADRLLAQIRNERFDPDTQQAMPLTVSIGVTNPIPGAEATADHALYAARANLQLAADAGGNCIYHEDTLIRPEDAPPSAPPAAGPTAGRVRARTASISELHQALQALAAGRPPETDGDALVRAVLPLLHAWNRSNSGAGDALLAVLEQRLGDEDRRLSTAPVDAR